MFFLDDIAMAPFKGFLFIAKEVAAAVEQERARAKDDAMLQLTALHHRFEAGDITEEQFEALETELLDRLEELG